ncbi:uncharacterized protein JCM10292_005249 [Rhodotorula paludigena]|uniref:uncharacterized protein n=1 Tax=Rhodotorula paludigena TaxID=86838 RepID=UPI00316F873B
MPASASTQPHIAPDSPRTTSEVGTEDWDVAQTTAPKGAHSTQTQPKTAQGPNERVLDDDNLASSALSSQSLATLLCVGLAGLFFLGVSICFVFDARKTHGKLRAPRSPSQALPHPPSPSFPTQANESQAYVCEHRHVYDDLATYLTARHLGEGAAQQAGRKSCGTRPGMALEMKGESQRERVGCSS